MPLHLHRAARTDLLADALGGLLASPLPDPFAEEVVVVPARGVERWLTQRLSHRLGAAEGREDGVCAGVRFLAPRSLVSLLLGREKDDPWDPERLVWPVLAVVDDSLGEPWCAALSRHLGHGLTGEARATRRQRRWSVAHHLARLFAAYAVQRPAMLAAWSAGGSGDGLGHDLPPDLAWQPELFRRVCARVRAESGAAAPHERHAATLAALEVGGDGLDLPARLSLFGHTRLPETEVALLRALAAHRDVHLWLPQASEPLWQALQPLGGPVPRAEDDSDLLVGHPLLASLGRDSRELTRTLHGVADHEHVHDRTEPAGTTLLSRLQGDLRANHAPDAAERAARPVDPADRSLQVHACHGPARQVEVLREVLVGLLQDDPTLEPRDILVMCPDVESYAPLVSAAFGQGGGEGTDDAVAGHPGHRLRVRLADRALSATNPLLGVAASLVELAGGRVTASEVLDLLATPVVRARFGLSDDDLDRVSRWVGEAGVRWGLDAAGRAPFSMDRFEMNTWRWGVDRVLLGVVMSGDELAHVGDALPLDDVGSSEAGLAGRLAEALDRVGACLEGLTTAVGVSRWVEVLRTAVRGLTLADDDAAWQLPQLERELAGIAQDAAEPAAGAQAGQGEEPELALADVRALLASRLSGRPTRSSFRTGTITVCTMVPMRSVPHRVVCLLGLDDGTYPRSTAADGDDVLTRTPLTGERDLRSEDRQLMLDAVLAASETLVLTYTGATEHSGSARPPAVPLQELLDAADRTCAEPVREHVVVHHPLQPHDARNLVPGALVRERAPRPFSFDVAARAGAQAAHGTLTPVPLLVPPGGLPEHPLTEVSLADLVDFVSHPVRHFLRRRLDVGSPLRAREVEDAMPVELDALEKWGVGDRLLHEILAGAAPGTALEAERRRGGIPPAALGDLVLADVESQVRAIFDATRDHRSAPARSVDVDVEVGGGRRVTGTVSPVHGNQLLTLGYSRLKARHRLQSWVQLIALAAGRPDEHWIARAVGRTKAGPQAALAGPLDHRAVAWLTDLVDLYAEGLRRPLPLPPETSLAWATAAVAREGGDPDADPSAAASRAWVTDPHDRFGIEGEDKDVSHRTVFGEDAHLDVLVDAGLPELALRLWRPAITTGERVGPL
ncbi:exodeoxyribonuclease V subunit gamma [Nocardioides bruguierae]|uniref:exodeoxyribonuclease V subunit gamma n=1 Tax=Nocardioides bruguierae TaxID=2945102 RepID=UPI002022974E|nr:exodeoxyribonuclease V subunit gamma [Nocardioides bruguierae]MCL8025433.1 exodeoxyribonuclease V subunit gamma [Nocardioides bruguierae]